MTASAIGPSARASTIGIPAQLRTDAFRFIILPAGSKGGPDNEPGWNTTANYSHDDPRLLAHIATGGNYGLFPSTGSPFAIVDADNVDACRSAGILDEIEGRTFAVETGGSTPDLRKFHFYVRCDPPFEGVFRPSWEGVKLGDIYNQSPGAAKGYVVGPGCLHPSGARYRVVNDRPIATIDRIAFAMSLARLAPKGREAKREATRAMLRAPTNGTISARLGLTVSMFLMPRKDRPTAAGEVEGEHPVHGSTTGTNLVIGPDCWYCRRHDSGGGPLEALAVAEGIIDCEDARPGCLEGKWAEVFAALKARGFDVDRK